MITAPFLRRFLGPILGKGPVQQLIRHTARQQWRLLALNLGSGLLQSFSEGLTFGVVFLAVKVLTLPPVGKALIVGQPFIGWMPGLSTWLNGVPFNLQFLGLLGLAIILQALQSLSRYLNSVSVGYFSARCRSIVALSIHRQVMSLTFPCASGYKVGDLADNINEGPDAIRIQIDQTSAILLSLLLLITYLFVLVQISLWLLLTVVLIGTLVFTLQSRLLPLISAGSERLSVLQAGIVSLIAEQFQGLRLLHSSGQLDASVDLASTTMRQLEHEYKCQCRRSSVIGPVTQFLPILSIAIISILSFYMFGGRNSGVLPSLITFVYALQKFTGQINILNYNVNALADNSGRYQRLNNLLSTNGKQYRRIGGIPFQNLKNTIRFQGVGLRYSYDLPASLSDVSFTLPKGHMLALVGSSGAGKSSIADLLTGLYEPTAGRILIDDTSLVEIDLPTWQSRLGVVSQDTFLFNATIAENIAFGTPSATTRQIEQASAVAQAADFIERLPQGYATIVGERGYRLSGGQRQRLSLARAILRNPELLILDEATSALDSSSEKLVQEALQRFEKSHTVLVIAHRLSTIVRANQILVLDKGKIVESGNHKTLLQAKGFYASMWNIQQSFSVPEA